MNNTIAHSLIGFALVASTLLATAPRVQAAESAKLSRTIKVGSSPVVSSIGIYLADDQGYFREQGLDVSVTDVANSGAPMTVLLASGELDVGAGNLTSGLFNSMSSGKGSKLVADKGHTAKGKDYIALLVRKDHIESGRFKTLKDLKGFKMGLTALDGVSQQILTSRMLEKAGLTEKDITYVKLSYAEMNVALKTKTLDATVNLEPFVTKAEDYAKVVARGFEFYPYEQNAAIFYSPKFLKDHDLGERFMAAYIKGIRLYNDSFTDKAAQEKVLLTLEKRINVDRATALKMTPTGLDNNGRLDKKSLQEDLSWYHERGYLKTVLKADDIVDESFTTSAVRILNAK